LVSKTHGKRYGQWYIICDKWWNCSSQTFPKWLKTVNQNLKEATNDTSDDVDQKKSLLNALPREVIDSLSLEDQDMIQTVTVYKSMIQALDM
jgi:hypothetical protein